MSTTWRERVIDFSYKHPISWSLHFFYFCWIDLVLYRELPSVLNLEWFSTAELGDHNAQQEGYVQQCRLLVRQTPKLEEKIEEIHASLAGTATPQAETQFLKRASQLDTYGVDPHPVKVSLKFSFYFWWIFISK